MWFDSLAIEDVDLVKESVLECPVCMRVCVYVCVYVMGGWGSYNLHDVDGELSTPSIKFCFLCVSDINEMATELVYKGVLALAYIMFVTGLACDACNRLCWSFYSLYCNCMGSVYP